MDEPHEDLPTQAPLELPWQPITELEIQRSLKAAKGSTAPGEDGLPTLVWKQLWVHLKVYITGIFTASVSLGYHPKRWRSAKIVVLRKPKKPDYSVPGAYRPISLLNTLGKLLEAVMARRLSYLAEKHGLLPDTQFGGRPGRTTEQALLVLSNAIDRAWYTHKVVTLVAFDLKGAFNGVNKVSLDACLRARRIPTTARKWIASFMSDRHASIGFDDFRTETTPLANAGLAQGSPLSPILFAFFNSDLVDQPVNAHGGASAFIDDYFRWRVGHSAEENLAKIQSEDIPEKTRTASGSSGYEREGNRTVTHSQTTGGGVRPGASLEGTCPASDQTCNQGQHYFGRAAASTPRTDATAPQSLRDARHGLRVDGLARSSTRQDPPTTLEYSPENHIDPHPISFQGSGHHDSGSGSTYFADTSPTPPPSAEHHRKPSHSAARPSDLGYTPASPET
ncbi:hypothetical protein DTO013F2_9445 [Penicillium roqueforti]|nr:hypothetical protein DTO013F2_9445 [Penicillium roqueforti]